MLSYLFCWKPYTDPIVLSAEGNQTVYWNCSDNAGNNALGNQTFGIDQSASVTSRSLSGTTGVNGGDA